MPTVRVRNESGEFEEVELNSKTVAFEVDGGDRFEPAVVERLEYDDEGGMSQLTWDTCKRTENRRESDKKPDITVAGVLSQSQLEAAKNLEAATSLTLISDLFTGSVTVKRLTIEQNTDLIHYVPDGGGREELAFHFQLQVKQE